MQWPAHLCTMCADRVPAHVQRAELRQSGQARRQRLHATGVDVVDAEVQVPQLHARVDALRQVSSTSVADLRTAQIERREGWQRWQGFSKLSDACVVQAVGTQGQRAEVGEARQPRSKRCRCSPPDAAAADAQLSQRLPLRSVVEDSLDALFVEQAL